MKYLISLIAGLIFAGGLVVGGMTQPGKVIGFLDFFGNWDPSLAFVMGGAVLVNLVLFKFTTKKREQPLFDAKFRIPTRSDIDWQLVGGAGLFGVGWGLAGYCPGPGLTALGSGTTTAFTFVGSMVGGMILYQVFDKYVLSRTSAEKAEEADNDSSMVGEKISLQAD
ncbi:MAG: DUF6691 family protein [Myxococcota bacterium]